MSQPDVLHGVAPRPMPSQAQYPLQYQHAYQPYPADRSALPELPDPISNTSFQAYRWHEAPSDCHSKMWGAQCRYCIQDVNSGVHWSMRLAVSEHSCLAVQVGIGTVCTRWPADGDDWQRAAPTCAAEPHTGHCSSQPGPPTPHPPPGLLRPISQPCRAGVQPHAGTCCHAQDRAAVNTHGQSALIPILPAS